MSLRQPETSESSKKNMRSVALSVNQYHEKCHAAENNLRERESIVR